MKNKYKDMIFFGSIILITSIFIFGAISWDYKQIIPEESTSYETTHLNIIYPIVDDDGIVYLVFDDIENAISYNMYRSKDEGNYQSIGFVNPVKNYTLIYKDIVLESGKYDYKIKVIYEIGESDFSNIRRIYVKL